VFPIFAVALYLYILNILRFQFLRIRSIQKKKKIRQPQKIPVLRGSGVTSPPFVTVTISIYRNVKTFQKCKPLTSMCKGKKDKQKIVVNDLGEAVYSRNRGGDVLYHQYNKSYCLVNVLNQGVM
jgi:hypothetical protein